MSDRTKEIAQLIRENPELPIRVFCSTEVVGGDDYSSWYAPCVSGRIDETCFEDCINDERRWVRSRDEGDMNEELLENPERLDGIEFDGRGTYYNPATGKIYTDAEIEALVDEYMENLEWEKCILLFADV